MGVSLAVFSIQSTVLLVATLALFVLEGWAFVDAVSRRPESYEAANKQNKKMWMWILSIALAALLITTLLMGNPVNFLNMIGIVAALVYLVDVRPAIRSLTRH